jgi:hypothetical protein
VAATVTTSKPLDLAGVAKLIARRPVAATVTEPSNDDQAAEQQMVGM